MNRIACRKLLIPFFFPLFFADPSVARSLPVIRHQIHVFLDVNRHFMKAIDTLTPDHGFVPGGKFSFRLRKTLRVSRILSGDGKVRGYTARRGPGEAQVISLIKPLPPHAAFLTLEYEGRIYNTVEKSRALSFVTGDGTAGLIGPGGVYLSAETLWYPVVKDVLSKFEIFAEINGKYTVVTQGELRSRSRTRGRSLSHWKSEVPVDGLALVAGKYTRLTRRAGKVTISIYLLQKREALARKYLRRCADYIKTYSGLLGPYPYGRFDIVENFFASGYGFPYFTLLGSGVFQRGEEALRPGYLDHEVVHSWWGNYVYNDFESGNWVEALTTYCANYYQQELSLGPVSAARYRKRVSLSYSQRVRPDREYPVKQFREKVEDMDGEIGYGKGSMVFHQLRRTVGDRIFWQTLRELVRRFGARYAGWEDIRGLFEEKSGRDLKGFFDQWLERKGGPRLRLDAVKVGARKNGYRLTGRVLQEGEFYHADVPVHLVFSGDRRRVFQLNLKGPVTPFAYDLDRLPVRVQLDPEFHLFKIIEPEDFPPSLNAALADPDKVFFVRGNRGEKAKIYKKLARMAVERRGGRPARPDEDPHTLLKGHSLIIFGNNGAEKAVAPHLPGGVKIGEDGFEIDGEKFTGPEFSLLLSIKNPYDRARTLTLYYGLGIRALTRAPYIFYYGGDGYLVFRNGRPVKRGQVSPARSRLDLKLPAARQQRMRSLCFFKVPE